MEDLAYEETRHGLTIRILQESYPESPSDWGDTGVFLLAFHRDLWIDGPRINGYKIKKEKLIEHFNGDKEVLKEYYVFPVEAYIHSGIKLYLAGKCTVDRAWDVSLVGAVLVSKGEVLGSDTPEYKAKELAEALLDTWNDYLIGNVYQYQIVNKDGEVLDSFGGFYGDFEAEGGALKDARDCIDYLTKNGTQDEHGQMLFKF